MKYIFHCGNNEQTRTFKEDTPLEYIDEAFDDWLYEQGLFDEADKLFEYGEAGYYEVEG